MGSINYITIIKLKIIELLHETADSFVPMDKVCAIIWNICEKQVSDGKDKLYLLDITIDGSDCDPLVS